MRARVVYCLAMPRADFDPLAATVLPDALAKTIGVELERNEREGLPRMVDHADQTDRFAVTREIGRGGMGRVLEATDSQFRRLVALKEMLADGSNEQARRRFVTEALVTANLQHPGIPAVYARGERSA